MMVMYVYSMCCGIYSIRLIKYDLIISIGGRGSTNYKLIVEILWPHIVHLKEAFQSWKHI